MGNRGCGLHKRLTVSMIPSCADSCAAGNAASATSVAAEVSSIDWRTEPNTSRIHYRTKDVERRVISFSGKAPAGLAQQFSVQPALRCVEASCCAEPAVKLDAQPPARTVSGD